MAKNKTAQKAETRRKAASRRINKTQQTEEKGGTFKVLRGFHIVDGKPLGKGETFESDQDLDVRFKEERKFKRIGDAGAQSEDEDDEDEETDVTAASKAAAKRNPKGEHDRSMGAVKDDGEEDEEEDDEAESEEDEDDEEEVGLQSADADEEDEEEESEEEDEEDGEDVTASDFKKEAKAAGGATVTKVGKTYTIADKKGKVIGRKTGYTKKADVKAALKKAAK